MYGRMRKLPGRNVGGEEGSRERNNIVAVVVLASARRLVSIHFG